MSETNEQITNEQMMRRFGVDPQDVKSLVDGFVALAERRQENVLVMYFAVEYLYIKGHELFGVE